MMHSNFQDDIDAEEQLSRCKYLFLRQLEEPVENQLRFVVEEAAVQTHLSPTLRPDLPELAELFSQSSPILPDSTSPLFEISFDSYISYTVSDESYGKHPQLPEIFHGNLFRHFEWSHLLEFTRKTSYASDEHPGPGPLMHFEVVCLNHVIDIIATVAPHVRVANTSAKNSNPIN